MTTDAELTLAEAALRAAEVAGAIVKLVDAGQEVPGSAADRVDTAHEALAAALDAYHHPKPTLVPHLQVVR